MSKRELQSYNRFSRAKDTFVDWRHAFTLWLVSSHKFLLILCKERGNEFALAGFSLSLVTDPADCCGVYFDLKTASTFRSPVFEPFLGPRSSGEAVLVTQT